MQALQSLTCPCGKHMFENMSRCPMCTRQHRSTPTKQTYSLPLRSPSKVLTPPPSQPSSPRRSTEVTVPVSPAYRSTRQVRAGRALDSAFSFSFEAYDDDEDGVEDSDAEHGSSTRPDIFPPRLYRQGSDRRRNGTMSRSGSESSGKEPSREGSVKSPVPAETKVAQPATNARASPPSAVEAPMAAAFARLSRKDVAKEESRKRDLSARLFDGPA